jgi:hypothetical protein
MGGQFPAVRPGRRRACETRPLGRGHRHLDICFTLSGTRGYDDLRREASRQQLDRGLTVAVASLRDVIRSKEAAGGDKDLAQLPLLRRTLEQIREHEREPPLLDL